MAKPGRPRQITAKQIAHMRMLRQFGLTEWEIVKRTGFSRPTVIKYTGDVLDKLADKDTSLGKRSIEEIDKREK